MMLSKEWHAVQVEWNREKAVADIFRCKGIEQYLPLYKVRRKWADRYKTVMVPVFTNYVFCRIDMSEYMAVVTSIGVVGIVRNGKDLAPIPEKEIADLRRVVDWGLDLDIDEGFSPGEAVRIRSGPLKGVVGRVVREDSRMQLVVSITAMNRAVRTTIDPTWAEPAAERRHPLLDALANRNSLRPCL